MLSLAYMFQYIEKGQFCFHAALRVQKAPQLED